MPCEHVLAELRELRPAMIDDRLRHRAQHAIGHVRRSWNLQEVTAGMHHDHRVTETLGSKRSSLPDRTIRRMGGTAGDDRRPILQSHVPKWGTKKRLFVGVLLACAA